VLVRLGKTEKAIAAFQSALSLQWEPAARCAIYTGLGRAYLALQNASAALSSFRQALGLASEPHTVVLCHYDIAVALDRLGDLPAALRAARAAVNVPVSSTVWGSGDVLVWPVAKSHPSYEVHYRAALGAMALAEAAPSAESKREHLARAVDDWDAYLQGAEKARAPWVRRARRHRDSCRRRLQSLASSATETQ
jgi:tetratricopeptide (TPR) repeat protein